MQGEDHTDEGLIQLRLVTLALHTGGIDRISFGSRAKVAR
jgi:hypothetical protein